MRFSNISSRHGLLATIMCALIAVSLMMAPSCSEAASYDMASGNSSASIDPTSNVGMTSWVIDGINQVGSQWWYYRIGDSQQQPINQLATPQVTQTAPNMIDILYSGPTVDVILRYVLSGGSPGSGNSTMAESVRVRNKTSETIDFHLFEFTDLNLNDTPGDDSAALVNPTTITQWDGGLITTESASTGGMTPVPDAWEIGNASYLFNKLNNDSMAVLADATTPLSGDIAFAFQWDLEIAAGRTDILSKSKVLNRSGAIGDTVWYDANGNGIQDDGEVGIADVTVILEADVNGDGVIDFTDTAVTDENGYYIFPNLPSGTYIISVDYDTLPEGSIQTYDLDGLDTQDTATINLASGEVNLNVDFGYWQAASVGDRVWNDINADGVQDEDEPGIGGVTVLLLDEEGEIVATTVTTDDGGYLFEDLLPGTYTVVVDETTLPSGLSQTYDLDGELDHQSTVTLAAGDARRDVDFGYTGSVPSIRLIKTGPETAQVGQTITYTFKVINTGDTYLYDVTVNDPLLGGVIWQKDVMAPGETVVFTRTFKVTQGSLSAANVSSASTGGFSSLCSSKPSCYIKPPCFFKPPTICKPRCFIKPRCKPKPPCDPKPPCTKKDKLVNLANVIATSPQDDIVTDQSSCTTTVGPALGSIGDRVWFDYNGNGKQDAGEPGINGVKLTLKDSYGRTIATAVTSGNGDYTFTGLAAGTYTVVVNTATLPKNLKQTYELDGSRNGTTKVSLSAGQNRTDVDFGYAGNKPDICIVKTGPKTAKVGDTITYTFKVTNTGNTTLTGVSVNDPLLGGVIWQKATMVPGETVEFTKTYVVKGGNGSSSGCGKSCTSSCPPSSSSGDVLTNTATVSGSAPNKCKISCTSSCKTTVSKAAACYVTYSQADWGAKAGSNAGAALLKDKFGKVYPCNKLTIGSYYKLTFSGWDKVNNFLPQTSKVGLLNKSASNATSSNAGEFAGNVLALRLNVDFSNAGITCRGLSALKLSNTALKGWTIGQALALSENVLGGYTCYLPYGVSVSTLNSIVAGLNNAYRGK
ncbi:MAG: DUF11 domain-containing protein [Armatimonadetes bacterium]|jgi:uncharacterized repeat protein (TIGR01451 family)|nr:DUF11 domain-containing protein [Armatimonadota bacterium]